MMNAVETTITPEMAQEMLKRNEVNRPLRQTVIRKYMKELETGVFYPSHQGIGFYEDGALVDGQHRLNAIVLSGIPMTTLVTSNVPRPPENRALPVDTGVPRRIHDVISLTGNTVTKETVATIRMLLASHKRSGMVVAEAEDLLLKYAESLKFVNSCIPGNPKMSSGALRAALVNAHHLGINESSLKEFCQILFTGTFKGPQDSAPMRLREMSLSNPLHNSSDRERLYRLTSSALGHYLCGRVVKSLRERTPNWSDPKTW